MGPMRVARGSRGISHTGRRRSFGGQMAPATLPVGRGDATRIILPHTATLAVPVPSCFMNAGGDG